MKCIRCGKNIYTNRIEENAKFYGGNIYACPNCGKAYHFKPVLKIEILPYEGEKEIDDWGKVIINDETYERIEQY